ncbi:deoxyguanosinetriphosphate triphosphohydrolase [Aurantimicrobium minutum]|uniref:Deoxyguanosinetriphosphate triphosphohydrolase-like protein n=1 Tax=Aurantimicrobium minutum TaxID=708131 RepID=A0A173LVI0_9MICO|nr:deoxyguanosinetriphosphate triphosphohydrolase [Aurantimicrobium minutum]BAU98976.1 deoxyguanosinetriphosphate triphosphohydrolase-like protein [Aurantimicrobium minutum]
MSDHHVETATIPTVTAGYSEFDAERMLEETHSSRRSDFARDRARLLHSSALRRLSAKTQVLSPTAGLDFARNRLTHSLEVAQVGREIAGRLRLDPDVVDTASLAHDIGHPPFGHNGEKALNSWSSDIGGFEGNAQTLRLLTRLEPKVFGTDGRSFGLNLTRASLDASTKYPWPEQQAVIDPTGRAKFGFYADDFDVFAWMRADAPDKQRCIEAQVMDLSDDIAYSVHDFEDAIFNGYVDAGELGARVNHDELVDSMFEWIGGEFSHDELIAAFDRLDNLDVWVDTWDGSRIAQAKLKNLTSQLIGRFAHAAVHATREAYPQQSLVRFGGNVIVPDVVRAEIAVLKGIVAAFVMTTNSRQPVYTQQREVLTDLCNTLYERGPESMDRHFADDWNGTTDEAVRRRIVVDQVASLTDQSAFAWHNRLCGGNNSVTVVS